MVFIIVMKHEEIKSRCAYWNILILLLYYFFVINESILVWMKSVVENVKSIVYVVLLK